MKWMAMIAASLSLAFAGADVARAADAYEVVTVPPASAAINIGIFRIDVATGQVVTAWGTVSTYTAIADTAKLPAGEYHLRVTETLDRTGGWYMTRYDAKSGRLWLLTGGGTAPFAWAEIAEPAATPATK